MTDEEALDKVEGFVKTLKEFADKETDRLQGMITQSYRNSNLPSLIRARDEYKAISMTHDMTLKFIATVRESQIW